MSDSEDFESADEGHSNVDKKERRHRHSSSNYSDNALETDADNKKSSPAVGSKDNIARKVEKSSEGWDDFDIDNLHISPEQSENTIDSKNKQPKSTKAPEVTESKDTGWDDFGDWGNEEITSNNEEKRPTQPPIQKPHQPSSETKAPQQTAKETGGWGWGWGVDSLLTSATAGLTSLSAQVSQGITTVLETGIGAPDPEDLARRSKETDSKPDKTSSNTKPEGTGSKQLEQKEESTIGVSSEAAWSLLSGVTKFVETTGTKVITGGLDTLETIGKKTMEVLQDGDPLLTKKRAMLGLDSGEKLVLSQVLREAKAKADEDDRVREEKREAKEVHYETLFDDFEGLVHLEALEMLSRQTSMRIEERLRSAESDKMQEIKETLQQVAELCEMPEEDEDEEESSSSTSRPDALLVKLQTATRDLGIKLQFQPIISQYADLLTTLESETTDKALYKVCVSALAQATALSVEVYHKTAEMLLVKTRRSTADEVDAMTQMTVVLTKHVGELATLFTEKMNSIESENKDQINTYITNIFLEAGNSSTYIQNAFQLALPILQIGAV